MLKLIISSTQSAIEIVDTARPTVRKYLYPTAEEKDLIRLWLVRAGHLMTNTRG